MKNTKEETPQEKSKRLEESLIRKQHAKRARTTSEKSHRQTSETFDVRLKKKHSSPAFGEDWADVHVTKTEFINIREQLSSTESTALLHPFNIQYWIPTQFQYHPNVYIGLISILIAFITIAYFFSKKRAGEVDEDTTPDISSPFGKGTKRLEGITVSEFSSLANNMRNKFTNSPNRKYANRFISIVNDILDMPSWNRDEEHLQILANQLFYIYDECNSRRGAFDDERDNLFDHKLFCSLERAYFCLRASNVIDHFQEKLLHQLQRVYEYQLQLQERQFERDISSVASSQPQQIETQDIVEVQTTTMSLMIQEISCQRQIDHIRRLRDDSIRDNDRKVRDIDRKLQQCRDRLLQKKELKQKLKRYKDERRFLMDVINRVIFVTVFLVVTIVFWSLQSTCSFQQGASSFLQCTFADAVETTCVYISSSDVPQSVTNSPSSSLVTFAFSPWSYMENLYLSPQKTLYSTAIRLPLDVLTVASSIVQYSMVGRGTILPYADYIYCGTYFLARCFPAYAVQAFFSMIYLSSVGSILSWLLLIWLFFDVVMKLIHEPLWPLIVLGAVQMVFYIISRFRSNLDFNRSWMLFYLMYMFTMAVFPMLWIYRVHVLSFLDNLSFIN